MLWKTPVYQLRRYAAGLSAHTINSFPNVYSNEIITPGLHRTVGPRALLLGILPAKYESHRLRRVPDAVLQHPHAFLARLITRHLQWTQWPPPFNNHRFFLCLGSCGIPKKHNKFLLPTDNHGEQKGHSFCYTSRKRTSLALRVINDRRAATSSPMRMENSSSAS